MDIPASPVKKRGPGRPRKEERKRRGRKPNPDKLKAIAAEKKPSVSNEDNQKPDVDVDVVSKTNISELNDVENKEINCLENDQQDEENKTNNTELDVPEKDQDAVEETQTSQSDAPENKPEESTKVAETLVIGNIDDDQSDTLEENESAITDVVENKQQDEAAELNVTETSSTENAQPATEQESKTPNAETPEDIEQIPDLQLKDEVIAAVEEPNVQTKAEDENLGLLKESNNSLNDQDIAFMLAVTNYLSQRSVQMETFASVEVNSSDNITKVLEEDKISVETKEPSLEFSDSKSVTTAENSDVSDTEDDVAGFESLDTAEIMGQDSDQMESIIDAPCQENSLERVQKDYSLSLPEASSRMKEKLPKCFVLLHRLTEDEINRLYPDAHYVNDDIKTKTEELVYKTEKALNASYDNKSYSFNKDRSQRRILKKSENYKVFELYKRKRESFIQRRNRSSFSENSLDYSQDESRTYNSDGEKPKKKLKRGRKYERDFEWRPDTPEETFHSSRPRRHCVPRTVIESDSTSSDEEDILYNIYMGYDIDDKISLQENLLSTEDISTSSVKNSVLSSNSFNNCSEVQQNKNHNVVTDLNTVSSKSNSDSGDILSGIIANMNQLQRSNFRASDKSLKPQGNLPASNMKSKNKQWHWRKITKTSSETDSKKEVAMLLRELISKVSSQTKQPNSGTKKFINVCKWCHTHFQTNRKTDVWCAICVDLRHGGNYKSVVSKRKPSLEKIKPFKENKIKKVNATKSRVLKILPQSEKQRLIYAEKTDKMSVEKGYSHLKNFDFPIKNKKNKETSQKKSTIPKNVENNTPDSQNKISIKMNKISMKPLKRKTSSDNINSDKSENVSPERFKSSVNGEPESKQSKNCISLKKCTDGLFLMTFPDPDKELDLEGKPLQTVSKQNEIALQNKKACNINDSDKPVSASSNNEQQINKQFETYLFPPLPTVIVSNYCSDANNLNLSNTFFQNEITHQQALKNTKPILPAIKSNDNTKIAIPKNPVTVTNAVSYQSSPYTAATLLPNNSPITITTIPFNSSVNNISGNNSGSQIQPIAIHSVPVLNTGVSVNNSNVSLLPVVSSVMTLADKSQLTKQNEKELHSFFSQQNYINSKQTEIRINNVTSLKTYEKHDSNFKVSNTLGGVTIRPVDSSYVSDCNQKEQVEISATNNGDKSSNRKRSNSDLNSSEHSEIFKTAKSNEKEISKLGINSQSSVHGNTTESNTNEQRKPENMDESSVSKQSDNSVANKENATPQTPISAALDMLGVISILAVIDLEKNPHKGLNGRILAAKKSLDDLTSEKNPSPDHNEKIAACQYNLQLLNIAKKYLNLYGSFIKVSDHLLRKVQISQKIQIKKEAFEESTQQSSCMYSQSLKSNNSLSGSQLEISDTAGLTPPVTNQIENFNSCRPSNQTPINHIEKLQSQIAAMNNVSIEYTQYGSFPSGGTVHHYAPEQIAALPPAIGAPTPVTPRNDCFVGESRETPSRGSGPRTPARPESAASQAEEQSLVQIKKEQFESASSPPSQCAYSQNTNLNQMPSQMPVISQVPTMPQHTVVSTPVHIPISSNQVYTNQTSYSVQQTGIGTNRITYTTNQNYSDVYLNVGAKHQLQISPVAQPQDMNQNRQVILPQQMFVQSGSGLCSKQAVPSINNNQYVIRPPFTTNASGTVIVNNPQVGQNALLTNVSNQQFYTSNQVSQLYYPQSSQITCMPANNVSAVVAQDISATQIQQADIVETPEQMLCAVCNSQATLRCKQCARVAYCNTTCANIKRNSDELNKMAKSQEQFTLSSINNNKRKNEELDYGLTYKKCRENAKAAEKMRLYRRHLREKKLANKSNNAPISPEIRQRALTGAERSKLWYKRKKLKEMILLHPRQQSSESQNSKSIIQSNVLRNTENTVATSAESSAPNLHRVTRLDQRRNFDSAVNLPACLIAEARTGPS